MNRLLLLSFVLLYMIPVLANDSIPGVEEFAGNALTEQSIDIPEDINTNLDSLLRDWRQKTTTHLDTSCDCDSTLIPTFSDSILIRRLASIPTIIPMTFNAVVKRCIDLYTLERREQVQVMLGLSTFFDPIFENALEKYQMPLELKYLPVVESALNPNAVSRAGATGLWQFMSGTGKMYGLEINTLIDDRRDPVKSTDAAVQYLKDLYDIFGDWQLAIAAYNCGPGNVNKAIKRSGGKTDYWDIYYYLPKETRGYVPLYIAASYVMTYYKAHELCPMATDFETITDTLWLNKKVHFDQISSVIGISKETLKKLNPQYRHEIIPASEEKPQLLRIPSEYSMTYLDYEDSIPNYQAQELLQANKLTLKPLKPIEPDYLVYKVKKGDTLSTIAKKHRVTVTKLKSWNNIHSSLIRPGQRIKIF